MHQAELKVLPRGAQVENQREAAGRAITEGMALARGGFGRKGHTFGSIGAAAEPRSIVATSVGF